MGRGRDDRKFLYLQIYGFDNSTNEVTQTASGTIGKPRKKCHRLSAHMKCV